MFLVFILEEPVVIDVFPFLSSIFDSFAELGSFEMSSAF